MLELNSRGFGCEPPLGLGVMAISVGLSCGGFVDEGFLIGDAAIEALRRKHAGFGFGLVKPAAALRRVDPFEALDEASRLDGGKRLVERGLGASVEIVPDEKEAPSGSGLLNIRLQ